VGRADRRHKQALHDHQWHLTTNIAMMPVGKITDLTYQRTLLGRCSATARSSSSPPARSRRCTA
jgi:hypothetical protein